METYNNIEVLTSAPVGTIFKYKDDSILIEETTYPITGGKSMHIVCKYRCCFWDKTECLYANCMSILRDDRTPVHFKTVEI